MLSPETGELSDRTEVLLYAADKAEHVDTVVIPALERGEVVITDRYVDSTLAYQGAGRALDVREVEEVARWATGDIRPHLTVVLDVDPRDGLGRFEGRDRIEAESLEFHERARQSFLDLAAADPDHYLVLDARADRDELADQVLERVDAAARPGDGRRGGGPVTRSATRTVWDDLVGQHRTVELLRTAAGGHGMSHAWLFTGPPGSGRSNAAIAFAAALQCEQEGPDDKGCGTCPQCHTVLAGSHPDVTLVRTALLSHRRQGRPRARAPIRHEAGRARLADHHRRGRRPADRAGLQRAAQGDRGADPRTVWMLCTPTIEDVLPTIRSRCRLVTLTTPTTEDVAAFLVRVDDVEPGLAAYAARASQGHIGRARALARDEATRNRRREIVGYPAKLTSLGACMTAAANLAEVSKEEAELITGELDAREKADLDTAYGVVERGRRPREYGPALKELEKSQNMRGKRRVLDVVDRGLMDLVSVYRDAIAIGTGAPGHPGQRGDPRRRRDRRPHLDARAQPAPDRLDLRRPRADARVQRPGAAGPRVDDGRAQSARRTWIDPQ